MLSSKILNCKTKRTRNFQSNRPIKKNIALLLLFESVITLFHFCPFTIKGCRLELKEVSKFFQKCAYRNTASTIIYYKTTIRCPGDIISSISAHILFIPYIYSTTHCTTIWCLSGYVNSTINIHYNNIQSVLNWRLLRLLSLKKSRQSLRAPRLQYSIFNKFITSHCLLCAYIIIIHTYKSDMNAEKKVLMLPGFMLKPFSDFFVLLDSTIEYILAT